MTEIKYIDEKHTRRTEENMRNYDLILDNIGDLSSIKGNEILESILDGVVDSGKMTAEELKSVVLRGIIMYMDSGKNNTAEFTTPKIFRKAVNVRSRAERLLEAGK